MKILYLHGLKGSPEGLKATYMKENYGAYVPRLDTQELQSLQVSQEADNWEGLSFDDIAKAIQIPLMQSRNAVTAGNPDVIIGSSMGGAILSRLVEEGTWSGPCIFLASAARRLFGILKLPPQVGKQSYWIHGSNDTIIPWRDSMNIAKNSGGTVEIIDDCHRLARTVELGSLECAIEKVRQ